MNIAKIRNVKTPNRGTKGSAGIDFFIPFDFTPTKLLPNESILIPSGIKCDIPDNYMLTAFNKSGIAVKNSIIVGACICDSDYQGEIHIHLLNVGKASIFLNPGDKIIQFVLVPVLMDNINVVDEKLLYDNITSRANGGFGSTGNN